MTPRESTPLTVQATEVERAVEDDAVVGAEAVHGPRRTDIHAMAMVAEHRADARGGLGSRPVLGGMHHQDPHVLPTYPKAQHGLNPDSNRRA
jgi:hypothetical protein